jgi:hypothetical protein
MPNKETRMTDDDFARIKGMFADNDGNLKVLRKIFFPELSDTNPVGMNFDLWTKLDLTGLSPEQKVIKVEANQMMVAHIEACLSMLKTLAGSKDETPEQTRKKLIQNSSK